MSPKEIAALPVHIRRAASAMCADGGLRAWLDAKFGEGKWTIGDYVAPAQRDAGVEIAIGNHEYADLAVEYGYGRLQAVFGSVTTRHRRSEDV